MWIVNVSGKPENQTAHFALWYGAGRCDPPSVGSQSVNYLQRHLDRISNLQ